MNVVSEIIDKGPKTKQGLVGRILAATLVFGEPIPAGVELTTHSLRDLQLPVGGVNPSFRSPICDYDHCPARFGERHMKEMVFSDEDMGTARYFIHEPCAGYLAHRIVSGETS